MELLNYKHCAWQHFCYLQQDKMTPSALQVAVLFFSVCSFLCFSFSGPSFLTHRMNRAKEEWELVAEASWFSSGVTTLSLSSAVLALHTEGQAFPSSVIPYVATELQNKRKCDFAELKFWSQIMDVIGKFRWRLLFLNIGNDLTFATVF